MKKVKDIENVCKCRYEFENTVLIKISEKTANL